LSDAYEWYFTGDKAAYPGFDPRSFSVKFMVDKVGLVFLVSIIPLMLLTHLYLHVVLSQKGKWAKNVNLPKAVLFLKLGTIRWRVYFH